MAEPLVAAPVEASPDGSAIAPVEIEGLPGEIEALGRRWQRKVEFHMTVMGTTAIAKAGADPDVIARVLNGRAVGPINVTRKLRRVGRHPDKPGLETIVVMVECPALPEIYRELSRELGVELTPPPAHVTLYSTDPEQGIGINNEAQLSERAPELSDKLEEQLRRSMRFDEVFGTSPQW